MVKRGSLSSSAAVLVVSNPTRRSTTNAMMPPVPQPGDIWRPSLTPLVQRRPTVRAHCRTLPAALSSGMAAVTTITHLDAIQSGPQCAPQTCLFGARALTLCRSPLPFAAIAVSFVGTEKELKLGHVKAMSGRSQHPLLQVPRQTHHQRRQQHMQQRRPRQPYRQMAL